MTEIVIGKETVVLDDKVFQLLSQYGLKVSLDQKGYPEVSGKLHHFVAGKPSYGLHIDHINRNKLDARRSNLRECTPRQNVANIGPRTGKKFKGISAKEYPNKDGSIRLIGYRAKIGLNGKDFIIGRFSSEEEAAYAYDLAARILQGEYAYLNFPNGHPSINYELPEYIIKILSSESNNYKGVPTIEPGIFLKPNGKYLVNKVVRGKKAGKVFDCIEDARDWRNNFMALEYEGLCSLAQP